jgi:putative endonuclease
MKPEVAHLILGRSAEQAAAKYLENEGYRVLERGWRRPWGELDIIAERKGTLHFVEVKAQRKNHAGFQAHLRAGHTKLEKVIRTARSWLATSGRGEEISWQVDVIEVTMSDDQAHIRHFINVTG